MSMKLANLFEATFAFSKKLRTERQLMYERLALMRLDHLLQKYQGHLGVHLDFHNSIPMKWQCDIYADFKQYCHSWSGNGKTRAAAINGACRKVQYKTLDSFLANLHSVKSD